MDNFESKENNKQTIYIASLHFKSTGASGGIEIYLRNMYHLPFNFIEYYGRENGQRQLPEKDNVKYIKLKFPHYFWFNKIVKNTKDKIIILQNEPSCYFLYSKKWLKNNIVFGIDHGQGYKVLNIYKHKNLLIRAVLFIVNKANNKKLALINFITYTPQDIALFKQNKQVFKSIDCITQRPTLKKMDKPITEHDKKIDLAYVGRFVNKKRPKTIAKLAKKNHFSVISAGTGRKIPKYFLSNYKGEIGTQEEKINIYKQARLFIMLSKSEGLPFTITEALSCGCTVLILNRFPGAEYYAKSPGVEIYKTIKEIRIRSKEIIEKRLWVDNIDKNINFVNETFRTNEFEDKWNEKIIKNLHNQINN